MAADVERLGAAFTPLVKLSCSDNHCAVHIIEFELETKYHLMFQALLQGEDGLALVRCVDGVLQLWTTSGQVAEVLAWLQSVPEMFHFSILDSYVWQGGT